MKLFIFICVVSSAIQAHAIGNADGQVGVDPIFQSEDAAVYITGDAAKQLYLHLKVDGGRNEMKITNGIACRKSINYGEHKSENYQCEMVISPIGNVTAGK